MQGVGGGKVLKSDPQIRVQAKQQPGLENRTESGCTKDHDRILTERAHLKLLKILILIIF
jgi:hypothetical protein